MKSLVFLDLSPAHSYVLRSELVCRYGRIDVLVNNAGIQPPESCVPIHTLPDHYWHQIIKVNVDSLFYASKLVRVQACLCTVI